MFRRVFLARLLLAALFGALLVPAQAQEKFSEPALSDPDSWTVVLLPDLQGYAKKACNQPIMEIMTSWIAAHAEALNTKLVLCVGDLVEQNDRISNGLLGRPVVAQAVGGYGPRLLAVGRSGSLHDGHRQPRLHLHAHGRPPHPYRRVFPRRQEPPQPADAQPVRSGRTGQSRRRERRLRAAEPRMESTTSSSTSNSHPATR